MKMEIYKGQGTGMGNLVFQDEFELPLSSETYLLGNEVFWDGTTNGQDAQQGVYAYQIWLKSLTNSNDFCPSCNCDAIPYWDTHSGFDIFYHGEVTLER